MSHMVDMIGRAPVRGGDEAHHVGDLAHTTRILYLLSVESVRTGRMDLGETLSLSK